MLYRDSYFVTSQVLRFGHLSKAETLLDTVLRFFATVDKEVMRVTFCFISWAVIKCPITRWSLKPGPQFTKYLTIYRKFIVRSTYDSDLQHAKTSFRNIAS